MIENKVLSGGTVRVDVTGGQLTFDVKKSSRSGRVSSILAKKTISKIA